MKLEVRKALIGGALCALLLATSSASYAGTIIKLNLGGVGPDVGMAGGVLGTVSDGNAVTTGDQNTAVEFTGFLNPLPDINLNTASFSLGGLAVNGPAQVFGTLAIQNFQGGSFSLYDPANTLLLSGALTNSALTGVMGPPGTGGLFTTTLSTVTGGTLQSLILPNTLTLSMNLSNVNGGGGLVVDGVLLPFVADGSVNIAGDPDPNGNIPEPTTLVFVLLSAVGAMAARRR